MVLHNYVFEQFDAFGFRPTATVHSVHQDRKGRLWIASEDGLHLFDGKEVKTFPGDDSIDGDIPHYFAKSITEGPDGRIWVGTFGGGFVSFDERSRRFQKPDFNTDDDNTRSALEEFDNKVWSMAVDQDGRLWIGSFTSGTYRYNPATHTFIEIETAKSNSGLPAKRIESIHIAGDGTAWIAPQGSNLIGIDSDSLDHEFSVEPPVHLQALGHPRNRVIYDIEPFPDSEKILVAYMERNLKVISPDGKTLQEIRLDSIAGDRSIMEALPLNEMSALIATDSTLVHVNLETGDNFEIPMGSWPGAIPQTIMWDLDMAPNGDILLGGTTGVWIRPESGRQFWTITQGGANPAELHEARAIEFQEDALFINNGSTIYKLPDFDTTLSRPQIFDARVALDSDQFRAYVMRGDEDIGFWATSNDEIFHIDPEGKIRSINNPLDSVHTLLQDDEFSRMLIAGRYGMSFIDFDSPLILNNASDSGSESRPTMSMNFGQHEDIWTGTFSGMHRYDRSTLEALPVFSRGADSSTWTEPFTNFFVPLDKNRLLIGTSDGLFDAALDESGQILNIRKAGQESTLAKMGFAYSYQRNNGNLLLVANDRLVEFDPDSGAYRQLPGEHVSPILNPYGGAAFQKEGAAILSGTDGPVIFRIDELDFDYNRPDLNLAEVVSFRDSQPVSWPINESLVFQHEDRVIRIAFGLIDYLNPEDNTYRLKLEGFSENWLEIDSLGEFSFTNLDAGDYTLFIEGRDGTTSHVASRELRFTVLPPWWQTWWAYTLYTILIIGSIVGYIFYLQRKLAREREISEKLREADRVKSNFVTELEKRVDEATADMRHALSALEVKNVELEVAQHRAQDASRLKSEFLANMSHEIRTPMNGVLGFAQLLKKSQLDTDQEEYVDTLESSAHSLLGIINDILDLSKIEAGKLIIDNTGFNLRTCALETLETLAPVAYDKGLELAVEIDSELPPGMRGDPVRMRQVVTNLVGNAIKFTDEGTVAMSLRPARLNGEDAMEIEITDTGRGITEEDRQKLFSAFERGKAEFTSSATGTGLGLVITKKLTEAMGGEIDLDSVPGEGTRVTLRFPLTPDRNPENRYEAPQPFHGRRIHLVDANEASRAAFYQQLRNMGADVMPAAAPIDGELAGNDMVAVGISRQDSENADEILGRLRERIGSEKPLLAFISRTDRSTLRELGEKHDALCLPKIASPAAQLRRIEDWLRGGEQPATASSGSQHIPNALEGLDILIADDNRINRFFLRKMLTAHGANVHEAVDGREALSLLGDGKDFHLALIDLHMPEVDGMELAERARSAGVTTPLIVVSANVLQETRDAANAAGFDDYILKPVEEAALLEVVRRHL